MSSVSLKINGKEVSASIPDNTILTDFLRENLGLTGTHVGCDTSQCGACVVHVDGVLSLIHISEPTDRTRSRMPSSA